MRKNQQKNICNLLLKIFVTYNMGQILSFSSLNLYIINSIMYIQIFQLANMHILNLQTNQQTLLMIYVFLLSSFKK